MQNLPSDWSPSRVWRRPRWQPPPLPSSSEVVPGFHVPQSALWCLSAHCHSGCSGALSHGGAATSAPSHQINAQTPWQENRKCTPGNRDSWCNSVYFGSDFRKTVYKTSHPFCLAQKLYLQPVICESRCLLIVTVMRTACLNPIWLLNKEAASHRHIPTFQLNYFLIFTQDSLLI